MISALFLLPAVYALSQSDYSSSINGSYAFSYNSTSYAPTSIANVNFSSTFTTVEVVQTLTVPCTGPTTITTNGGTYTATDATTLTITDCPCTVTHTATSANLETGLETDSGAPESTNVVLGTASPSVSLSAVESVEYTTTEHVSVVKTLTVPCSGPTTITTNGATYTATEATTLTITDCPCTQTIKSTIPVSTLNPTSVAAEESAVPTKSTVVTVVSTLVTEIASPTVLVTNGGTYTVTEATILSITDCPCTVSSVITTAEAVESANVSSPTAYAAKASGSSGSSTTPGVGNGASRMSLNGAVVMAALLLI